LKILFYPPKVSNDLKPSVFLSSGALSNTLWSYLRISVGFCYSNFTGLAYRSETFSIDEFEDRMFKLLL